MPIILRKSFRRDHLHATVSILSILLVLGQLSPAGARAPASEIILADGNNVPKPSSSREQLSLAPVDPNESVAEPALPTDTHERAAVFTQYNLTPGGGEKYILSVIRELQRYTHDVDLLVFESNVCRDTKCVVKLAASLDVVVDESRLRVLVAPMRGERIIGLGERAYRVFVLLGNHARPQVMPCGRYNVYVCQFPFDYGTPFSEGDLLVFNAYDRVLVYSKYAYGFFRNGTEAAVRELEARHMLAPELKIVYPPVSNMSTSLGISHVEHGSRLDHLVERKKRVDAETRKRVSIAVVGRFFTGTQSKGHGSAIEALRLLVEKDHTRSYELHLVGATHIERDSGASQGQSELLRSLREKATGLPVQFHIDASRQELISVLVSSDFFWHMTGVDNAENDPAGNEHFGISVVEGMQLGCVPIVYYLGGPKEIVMEDERLQAKDVHDFADRTLDLLSLPGLEFQAIIETMSARATDFSEDFFSERLAADEILSVRTWYEYKRHVQSTMPALYSKQCAFASSGEKMALIIEPRPSPMFKYVVHNAGFYLNGDWRLRVYHGTENAGFVREKLQSCRHVEYVNLGYQDVPIERLNRLLMSLNFWENVNAEHVLVFQTDSLLLRKGIEEFVEYDFVGAPWHPGNDIYKDKGIRTRVGNGGLSLRRASSMIAALQRCSRVNWRNSYEREHEDFFYSRCLDIMGKNVPDHHTAASFAIEVSEDDSHLQTTIGLHKPFVYLSRAQLYTALDSSEHLQV